MKPAIGKMYMFLPTANDVWDVIRETYSDAENASQIFQDAALADDVRRSGSYGILHRDAGFVARSRSQLRREMRVCFKKKMDKEKVFKFLAGLNRKLDDVKSRVLNHQSLPSIREVFFEVQREESKKKVMLQEDLTFGLEASALVTHGPHIGFGPRQSKMTCCEHCKKMGHTKNTC
ncbi:hypothetical protein CK203_115243 [Vitis vinifera]|uniref:Uncharacterized protein n=1 Tax=Vitis vinifera TaxID=29760 RepID=A0A438FD58_VITVI|nr:hypothetical protein CK203_115243 [Vitis vinifera]